MKVALFSGRFDPPHIGHLITILELLNKYNNVLVVVLDYKERKGCSAIVACNIFRRIFSLCDKSVSVIKNNIHFCKISEIDLSIICVNNCGGIKNVTYVGGNEKVNKHIESLGVIPVEYIPRFEFYNSTEIREDIKRGKTLEEIYGIGDE